ncbi:hypothetical protein V3C41_13120 [Paenarthrobacter nicotinovorans]|uniref:Uncharacterized protein n=1 Tax=Paenarthrobacter nicotinovorans TaxID=29320 RepID=A0ABV0GUE9_PAENI
MIAGATYAALWVTKLRGRQYRRYPGTTWILVAGPIVAAVPLLALIGLITANTIMW